MSNRLGVILPKQVSKEILDTMRFKYDFDLIKIDNKTMNRFLNDEEDFYILHKYGERTGISKYDSYNSISTRNDSCRQSHERKLYIRWKS